MGKAFVGSLTEDLRPIYEILKNPVPMVMLKVMRSNMSWLRNAMLVRTYSEGCVE